MATPDIRQCNSCGGIYRAVQRDGVQYFHQCPPSKVLVGEVRDAQGKLVTPATLTPTPNPRDENITLDAQRRAVVKLGDPNGYTPVVDPVVISTF